MLDDRKERILRAVVDDYVASGEPVGSRALVRNHGFALSPATIRNEMADLVDSGYLEQPHASAGRIPSDKGYRYYVDHFVRTDPAERTVRRVAQRILADARETTATIRTTARFLSEASRFLALVTRPQTENCRIETLRVVPVREDRALLVLVTDDGQVEHRLVELEAPVGRRELDEVNRVLAEV
ncbi:MAG: heat-inducible transcription repressor HrcA, partial [Clostridia bacterium]|nr:heat-inducible transcription repressor HrcA [Clostridia bacterium]